MLLGSLSVGAPFSLALALCSWVLLYHCSHGLRLGLGKQTTGIHQDLLPSPRETLTGLVRRAK